VVLKSELVMYYEVITSMWTVAVFKSMPAITWPNARLIITENISIKSNVTNDIVDHDYKLTILTYYWYNILSRTVDVVQFPPMRSNAVIRLTLMKCEQQQSRVISGADKCISLIHKIAIEVLVRV